MSLLENVFSTVATDQHKREGKTYYMDLVVGAIVSGRVTGITKFGAFISIVPGKSGLVHISEISNTYVNDINSYLTEGQEVTVKIIGIDDSGRINLSIKAALPPSPPAFRKPYDNRGDSSAHQGQSSAGARQAPSPRIADARNIRQSTLQKTGDVDFEDRLKRFMQDSDSKISGIRQYSEKKSSRRRGGGK